MVSTKERVAIDLAIGDIANTTHHSGSFLARLDGHRRGIDVWALGLRAPNLQSYFRDPCKLTLLPESRDTRGIHSYKTCPAFALFDRLKLRFSAL